MIALDLSVYWMRARPYGTIDREEKPHFHLCTHSQPHTVRCVISVNGLLPCSVHFRPIFFMIFCFGDSGQRWPFLFDGHRRHRIRMPFSYCCCLILATNFTKSRTMCFCPFRYFDGLVVALPGVCVKCGVCGRNLVDTSLSQTHDYEKENGAEAKKMAKYVPIRCIRVWASPATTTAAAKHQLFDLCE